MNNAIGFGATSITGAKQTFSSAFKSLKVQVGSEHIEIKEEGDKVTLKLSGGNRMESLLSTILSSNLSHYGLQGKLDIVSDEFLKLRLKIIFQTT